MGLFSKKEEVPSIQPATSLPKLPAKEQPENNLPELPSFPTDSKTENINQEMVKSAVADAPSPGEEEVHVEIPKGMQVKEEPAGIPPIPKTQISNPIPQVPRSREIDEEPLPSLPPKENILPKVPKAPTPTPKTVHHKEGEPVFVRIDKFQSAQKNLELIKTKIQEMESILNEIKDVKAKEEEELKGWTEDIEQIKSRLTEVDTGIFDQI